ncbi:MAG: acetyl-CoA hydrolase/transferase C-terminal domain-containing protein [Eubacteriales bacterium]|nr:acetyl-CoA hydrolase/transferase C-terminal domain-containing protein [Eubacteriales bacterium]
MNWKKQYADKIRTPKEAASIVQDEDRVYIGTCTSVARTLARALGDRAEELRDVWIGSSNVMDDLIVMKTPEHFHVSTYYMGPGERKAYAMNNCSFTSVHLSELDLWFKKTFRPNVSFIEVSEPDAQGRVSLGPSGVGMHVSAMRYSDCVILEINPNVPYVYGDEALFPLEKAECIVEGDDLIPEVDDLPPSEDVCRISEYIVSKVPDGSCIQLGIGGIGHAVGYGLREKNDLGIHTEAFTNSMAFLVKNGNVTNSRKSFCPGKSTASFALGTKSLYDFLDHNENVYFTAFSTGNDPRVICRNDHMISINSCISIDLYGQVASDNINGRQFSAVGGQVDFVRGAQMSRGGKSFIAATSVNISRKTGKKTSRIVSRLAPGTVVTTSRADVNYIVTEHGAVDLRPLDMRDRAHALILLADPEFRPMLIEDAKKMGIY